MSDGQKRLLSRIRGSLRRDAPGIVPDFAAAQCKWQRPQA
jgi:hypothetical protein